jgi:hypothetical protein
MDLAMNYATLATISLIVAGLLVINSGPVVNAQSTFQVPPPPTSQIISQPPLPSIFAQPCVNNGSNVLGKDTGKQIVNQENQCAGPRNNVIQPPPSNQAPIANAGPNQVVSRGSLVTLNGAGSSAQNGATIVSYSWVQTSGTVVSLNGANTVTPTFVAPTIANTTSILVFSLAVTDSAGLVSSPSTVSVTVT